MVMAIYAYRIFSNKKALQENKLEKRDIKNWVIFAIFSLISQYTHYYGLMAAGITNILLFIWILKDAIKQKKFTVNIENIYNSSSNSSFIVYTMDIVFIITSFTSIKWILDWS